MQRSLVTAVICLALPTLMVYGIPTVMYNMPIANRIGEKIFILSNIDITFAVVSVVAALFVWLTIPLCLRHRLLATRPTWCLDISDWWPLFIVMTIIGVPAGIVNSIVAFSPKVDNLLRIASLLCVSGFGLGYGLLRHNIPSTSMRIAIVVGMSLQFVVLVMLPIGLGYLNTLLTFIPVWLFLIVRDAPSLSRALLKASIGSLLLFGLISILHAGKSTYREYMFGGEFKRVTFSPYIEDAKTEHSQKSCSDNMSMWGMIPVSDSVRQASIEQVLKILSKNNLFEDQHKLMTSLSFDLINGTHPNQISRLLIMNRELNRTFAHDLLAATIGGVLILDPNSLDEIVRVAKPIALNFRVKESPGLQLALAYYDGKDLPKDLSSAARLLMIMLPSSPLAAAKLGRLFEEGRGVSKDMTLSLTCFKSAAERGSGDGWNSFVRLAGNLAYTHKMRQIALDMARKRADHSASQHLSLFGGRFATDQNTSLTQVLSSKYSASAEYDVNSEHLRSFFKGIDQLTYGVVNKASSRLNQLGNLAVAIREVPLTFEPLGWKVYYPLLTWPIPRLLWSDKPREESGLLIGYQLGLAKPADPPVSWSMPVLVEAWLAGGWHYYVIAIFVILAVKLLLIRVGIILGEGGILTVTTTGIFSISNSMSSGLSATCVGTLQVICAILILIFLVKGILRFYIVQKKINIDK